MERLGGKEHPDEGIKEQSSKSPKEQREPEGPPLTCIAEVL
jgi:hypothetical protein